MGACFIRPWLSPNPLTTALQTTHGVVARYVAGTREVCIKALENIKNI